MKSLKSVSRISLIVITIATMLLCLTGCSKNAVTTDTFKSIATEKGLVTADVIEQFADYDYVKEATIAAPSDYTYQIEFYVLADESYAASFFASNKVKFEQAKGSKYSESSNSGSNFSSYTLTSNDRYQFVEQVDSTVIYVDVDKENQKAVEEFIKELKY